jgi:FkbM family methyltransferase
MHSLHSQLLYNLKRILTSSWSDSATFLDVFFTYRLLLQRTPEFASEDAYKERATIGLNRLVRTVMESEEFRRLWRIGQDPLPDLEVMAEYGDRRYWFNLRDREIGHLIAKGSYEPEVEAVMRATIHDGMNVLDIGANLGFFSILMGKLVGHGQVHALEPFPTNYALLLRNIRENGLEDTVTAHQLAAYGTAGTAYIYFRADSYNDNLGSMFLADQQYHGHSSVEVRCVRVDDLVSPDIPIHCVKIDVEGSELHALKGMKRILSAWHPIILIELNEYCLQKFAATSVDELLAWITIQGYKIYEISNGKSYSLPNQRDTYALVNLLCS